MVTASRLHREDCEFDPHQDHFFPFFFFFFFFLFNFFLRGNRKSAGKKCKTLSFTFFFFRYPSSLFSFFLKTRHERKRVLYLRNIGSESYIFVFHSSSRICSSRKSFGYFFSFDSFRSFFLRY